MIARLLAVALLASGCGGARHAHVPPATTPPATTVAPAPEQPPSEYVQDVIFGMGAPNDYSGPAHMVPHLPARLTYACAPEIAPVAQAAARHVEECSGGTVQLTRVAASMPHDIPIQFSDERDSEAAARCFWRFDADGYLVGGAAVFFYSGRWYDENSLTHELGHCALGLWHSPSGDDRMGGRQAPGFGEGECSAWRAYAMARPGRPAWAGPQVSSVAIPDSIP